MQNYRNHAMPYNSYRQAPAPACMNNRDTTGNKSLAMAYVPWQIWRDLYDTEKGFQCGTIFKELNLPFTGKGGVKR